MPNNKCSVSRCLQHSSSDTKSHEISVSFFRFPKNKEPVLQKQWLKAIHRNPESFKITPYSRVCSKHFKDSDYVQMLPSGRKFLKRGVIPSLFDWDPSYDWYGEHNISDTGTGIQQEEILLDIVKPAAESSTNVLKISNVMSISDDVKLFGLNQQLNEASQGQDELARTCSQLLINSSAGLPAWKTEVAKEEMEILTLEKLVSALMIENTTLAHQIHKKTNEVDNLTKILGKEREKTEYLQSRLYKQVM